MSARSQTATPILVEEGVLANETMVARSVRRLIELSLKHEDGAYLGSEGDLLRHFGISRPTLRQAAKVVESGRLIAVRRGVNGGFYAARPIAADVVQAPALFLRLKGANILDAHEAARMVLGDAVARAAVCPDTALRDRLAAFRRDIATRSPGEDPPPGSGEEETAFARLIAEMSGNPVLILFVDIIYAFGPVTRAGRLQEMSEPDLAERRLLLLKLCGAILDGDADVARILFHRRADLVAKWLGDDEPQ